MLFATAAVAIVNVSVVHAVDGGVPFLLGVTVTVTVSPGAKVFANEWEVPFVVRFVTLFAVVLLQSMVNR